MKKWAIWAPWVKKFFTLQGGAIMFFDNEADAKKWAADVNATFLKYPHLHGSSCKCYLYVAVPWDEQAQRIAEGAPI